MSRKVAIATGLIAIVALFQVLSTLSDAYVSWLWFGSLGYASVFGTMLLSQAGLFGAGFVLFLSFFVANLMVADRLSRAPATEGSSGRAGVRRRSLMRVVASVASVALAVVMGLYARTAWSTLLLYFNAQPFGQPDPVFGRDIAYYVFNLPALRFLQDWVMASVVVTGLVVAAIYGVRLVLPKQQDVDDEKFLAQLKSRLSLPRPVRLHLAVFVVLYAILMMWNYRLAMYELSFSPGGAVYGATYVDIAARLPALWAAIAAAAVAGLAVAFGIYRSRTRVAAAGLGIWALAVMGGLWLYPSIIQRLEVQPSELSKERPYIERNIAFTRTGFGLDRIGEIESPAEEFLQFEDVRNNPGTIRNIRLWDPQPLLDTYNQIQSIRLYYDFTDVDVDRYIIDGEPRQVMLAARELSPAKLPAEAQTWVNRRLQFTHGYGVAASPVNEVTPEGLPTLWLRDVPPQGKISITRPEIYYGEGTDDYVIVGTAMQEFDYPKGDENVYQSHDGTGGVELGSPIRRAVFAWSFGDVNILLSSFVDDESRILFNRQIEQRARTIAPFLHYDADPYVVVDDSGLFWVQDAYTYSYRYPYSTPYPDGWFNYIRNSVKVVTSAYDGTITFYVADEADPILRTYAGIFPTMFRPLAEMPEGLREHLRYPQDLFRIQADMYSTYHMQDPQVFYNREDNWSIPTEKYFDSTVTMEPYYVITRLPGEDREEFVLIRPYTPPNKNNMITWLAARSDGEDYGTVVAYKYPKDRLIYGPMQIEARIDQDPVISEQLTLWGQAGSNVIRGNMIVLPVGGANLYVEPIYLQAEGNSLPEMKRVVLAVGNQLTMQTTVETALAQLYGQAPQVAGQGGELAAPATAPATAPLANQAQVSELLETLNGRYSRIQEEMRSLEEELNRLSNLLGVGTEASQ